MPQRWDLRAVFTRKYRENRQKSNPKINPLRVFWASGWPKCPKIGFGDRFYEYLQLQTVPDDFPIAKKANLFFMLNPDNFVVNVLGPDVMTYTKVEIDPKISEMIPELADIYQRWLLPIQNHHAAFSIMEGIAEFVVQSILKNDNDFENYLTTFMGTDFSSYKIRKNMGRDLTDIVFQKFGKNAFKFLMEFPPGTKEIKEPELYLKRDLSTGTKNIQ